MLETLAETIRRIAEQAEKVPEAERTELQRLALKAVAENEFTPAAESGERRTLDPRHGVGDGSDGG